MRKLTSFLTFIVLAATCLARNEKIDSNHHVFVNSTDAVTKVKALNTLSELYELYKPDSAIITMQMSLDLAKQIAKQKNEFKYEFYSLSKMALLFRSIGNYPRALEYNIELLKLAEEKNDVVNMASANVNISGILQNEKEYQKALEYCTSADSLINIHHLANLRAACLANFGNIYFQLNKPDLAIDATMNCYGLAKQKGDDYLTGVSLNNLGNIYSSTDRVNVAFENYFQALSYSAQANDFDNICESYLGIAKLFERTGKMDSAILYANYSLRMAANNSFAARELQACTFLTQYYKALEKHDSAFKYQEQMISLKDSINSNERIKASLIITIDEELRQHEKIETIKKEKEERNKTLQLLAAGMCVPSLFLFTLFISRKKIKVTVIKFCGIVSLLMLFECLTLLLHPYVVNVSGHVPVIELLIFVCIAGFVIPTHHKVEHWLISKLTFHKSSPVH